jgi:hypothetical protein
MGLGFIHADGVLSIPTLCPLESTDLCYTTTRLACSLDIHLTSTMFSRPRVVFTFGPLQKTAKLKPTHAASKTAPQSCIPLTLPLNHLLLYLDTLDDHPGAFPSADYLRGSITSSIRFTRNRFTSFQRARALVLRGCYPGVGVQ